MYHAFTIQMMQPSKMRRKLTMTILQEEATFIAIAEQRRQEDSKVSPSFLRGIFWMPYALSLSQMRARLPDYVDIGPQIMDMKDYRRYFEDKMWYDKEVTLLGSLFHGMWPTQEQFWEQRPTPGSVEADPLLCYHDIRSNHLSLQELQQRYASLMLRHRHFFPACFEFFRGSPLPADV